MTGIDGHNFPAFNAAAERLRGFGLEVVNPADHGVVDGMGWSDYMRWDIVKLAGCHSVYVLPGWEKSKGASLEVSIARALGMLVFTVDGAPLASAPVAGEAHMPPGYRVKAVDGHGYRITPPTGSDWVAHSDTPAGDLIAALVAAPKASEAVRLDAQAQ
ncbi:hypothetical protein G6F57_021019 [Rhizopus arrhizus]|nr:hypothetical protein G6F57_021019 [Rhizopus arrhizus]